GGWRVRRLGRRSPLDRRPADVRPGRLADGDRLGQGPTRNWPLGFHAANAGRAGAPGRDVPASAQSRTALELRARWGRPGYLGRPLRSRSPRHTLGPDLPLLRNRRSTVAPLGDTNMKSLPDALAARTAARGKLAAAIEAAERARTTASAAQAEV